MLQVAMSGGEVRVVEVPEPVVRPGTVLVRTSHSLISAGTESASIGSGGRRENLVLKAIRNPALVMKVVDRVASHGLKSTAELVKTRVSTEMPSGYSCAGVVADVGEGVVDIHVGDRVACAGAGYANHAAVNVVPRNLVARIPDAVSFEEAAFATLGAIALQGVRRAEPGLGDRVAVLGLGLLGQITAQMLHAAGAVVIGVDVRPDRVARAQALGLDAGLHRRRARLRGGRPRADGGPRGGRGDRDRGRRRRGAPQQGLRGVPEEGPGRAGRRRPDPHPARQDLQEGDRLPDLDLVRARPLRRRPTRRRATTTRSATCAGPRAATSRRCCARSRRALSA